eukprot:IDg4579t1
MPSHAAPTEVLSVPRRQQARREKRSGDDCKKKLEFRTPENTEPYTAGETCIKSGKQCGGVFYRGATDCCDKRFSCVAIRAACNFHISAPPLDHRPFFELIKRISLRLPPFCAPPFPFRLAGITCRPMGFVDVARGSASAVRGAHDTGRRSLMIARDEWQLAARVNAARQKRSTRGRLIN